MKVPDSFKFSNKHIQIDKSYAKMVAAIAFAASLVIFSLVVSNSLIKQIKYQNKVIGLRNTASKQLKANVAAVGPLVTAYETFDGAPESVLGTSDKNATIVLDALPSKYDFPALATSLEYVVQQSGMSMKGISGIDNEATAEQNSVDPKVVEIPFDLTVSGSYANTQKLVSNLEKSIRPFSVSELTFSGGDSQMTVAIRSKTYYQPEKKLEIKQVVVPGTTAKRVTVTSTTGSKK